MRTTREWLGDPVRATASVAALSALLVGGFVLGVILAAASAAVGPLAVIGLSTAAAVGLLALDRPMLAVAAVAACLPIGHEQLPAGPLDIDLVLAVSIAGAGLVLVHRVRVRKRLLVWSMPLGWSIALLGAAVIATPTALDLERAIRFDLVLLGGISLAFATATACRTLRQVRVVVAVLVVAGVYVSIEGIRSASDLQATLGGAVAAGRATATFTSPNQLGTFTSVVLMISIGAAFAARTTWGRVGAMVGSACAASALALSLSRGAWFGALCGLALLAFLLREVRSWLFRAVPVVLVGLALSIAVLPAAPPQVQVIGERVGTVGEPGGNPYDSRPDIWREAVREIRLDPVTGHGPANFPVASRRAASLVREVSAVHAHNALLTAAAEGGIMAVTALIGLGASVALLVVRTLSRVDAPPVRSLVAGLAAALATRVGHGLVDFTLQNPVLHVLVWLVFGLLVATCTLDERHS